MLIYSSLNYPISEFSKNASIFGGIMNFEKESADLGRSLIKGNQFKNPRKEDYHVLEKKI
jgi:hypothetical protein